jgi:hypothetical protein
MTIFIAHEPRGENIDLQPLYDYANGQPVQFVYGKTFNISQHSQEAYAVAENFAATFDFANDQWGVVGGDPLAGVVCSIALTHAALDVGVTSIRSFRYIREKDPTGARTIPRYLPIFLPTGV